MENYIGNLQTKNIKDFNSEDTIYLTGGTSQFPITYYCQFEKYESGKVTGKKIKSMVNESSHSSEAGESITCKLDRASLYGKGGKDKRTSYHHFDVLGFCYYELDVKYEDSELPQEHPSYCTVRFARIQSNGNQAFFGASIKPNNYVQLEIYEADIRRDLSHDWIHGNKRIIEVAMTEQQFAECITSLNMGSGTPATLKFLGNSRLPEPPFMGKAEQHSKEFANKMSELAGTISLNMEKARTILNADKPMSKKERAEILNIIDSGLMQISSNIPFYDKSFKEQMNRTISEAKMEIEQHIVNRARAVGLPLTEVKDILSIDKGITE